jgi:hypothetical protein
VVAALALSRKGPHQAAARTKEKTMSDQRSMTGRIVLVILILAVLITAGIIGAAFLTAGRTIFQLLNENKKLKDAITNLTAESQIGYAKVISQTVQNGKTVTRLLFVETDRDDPAKTVLSQEYEIEGDIAHFDALIVKFSAERVMDGKERALYLWRRVYGDTMSPEQGFPIETAGAEPKRYAPLFKALPLRDRNLFWSEIWKLSNDPDGLREAGVQAIYGNVVYKKLRPGLIYVFKISNAGTLYLQTVPAL